MLHEILLSLSGHPSPLFDEHHPSGVDPSFPLLSPPEKALLSIVSKLSRLHRDLRTHTKHISSSHKSTICRAVATVLQSAHLGAFQQQIISVEDRILRRDPSCVGAYNIVPLAGIVGEFDCWTRRLEWYWELCCFMLPVTAVTPDAGCSGAALVDKLRAESQTGYPDIEEAALGLGKAAEAAWMRQLATWVLYGRLPTHGANEFFILQPEKEEGNGEGDFEMDSKLLPQFVSAETAASILFVGRSLNLIRSHGLLRNASSSSAHGPELGLLKDHLQCLSGIVLPVSSSSLSSAIAAIRLSLSRNMLQQLLPLPKIIQIMSLLRDFFLLGRGEFAVALISEADDKLRFRNRSSLGHRDLKGLLLKEAEVNTVLTKTWSSLAAISSAEDYTDEILELARDTVRLTTEKVKLARPATPSRAKAVDQLPRLTDTGFNDALLAIPTTLTFSIPSPFDLFITTAELNVYSSLHAYLLAIRRAHIHLTELWRESSMRREHLNSKSIGQELLETRRTRSNKRNIELRKVWATCSAAIFLLAEMGEHFEGQVVDEAWEHLRKWITAPTASRESHTMDQSLQLLASSVNTTINHVAPSLRASTVSGPESRHAINTPPPRDPEALAAAHRTFLSNLVHSLLITNRPFTRLLRTLLFDVDALVAYIRRLQHVRTNLDFEADEGVLDPMANYAREEREVGLELDRARKRVDSDLRAVVARLREIDAEGMTEAAANVARSKAEAQDEYVPMRAKGVERLLMKLDFRAQDDEEDEMADGDAASRGLVQVPDDRRHSDP